MDKDKKPTFSLEDVTLTPEDAEKPADLDLPSKEVDTSIVDEKKDVDEDKKDTTVTDTAADDDAKDTTTDKKDDAAETTTDTENKDKKDEKPVDAASTTTTDTTDKKDEKKEELTPFHEHPDWKKMQETVTNLQKENEDLKNKNADPFPTETPEQRADARVRKEWEEKKHKDQFAAMQAYNRYVNEEKEKDVSRISSEISSAFSELSVQEGSIDAATQEKVAKQVQVWRSEGFPVSPATIKQTLKFAYAHLKKTGALNDKPADTTTQDKSTDTKAADKDKDNDAGNNNGTAEDDTDKKDDKSKTNSKIAKPKGSSGKLDTDSKVVIPNAKGMSLGQLVENLGEQL